MKNKKMWVAFWVFVGICIAAGIAGYFLARDVKKEADDRTVVNNSERGYNLVLPQGWYADHESSATLALYPEYEPGSASSPSCKIEIASFPYATSTSRADWIFWQLSKDPTLNVQEISSDEISVGNASGIRWTGQIDGTLTTIIYAFSGIHAYEISFSDARGLEDGPEICASGTAMVLNGINFLSGD